MYKDTGAAQMHDWLKEQYPDFPKVTQKTIYNFVFWVRNKYNIPYVPKSTRDYTTVLELPFWKQTQADFGEYSMRCSSGRIKVHFFAMQLCSSRMNALRFQLSHFTTESSIISYKVAFKQLEGMPEVVVYEQDKVFLTDENLGEYLTTKEFGIYASERKIKLHFCRKSDLESKGKIENLVKYVKQNFLHNRIFEDIQTFNDQAEGWLVRTRNGIEHTTTKKIPFLQWLMEKQHLRPYYPLSHVQEPPKGHGVLKDNTIRYRGNIYSLPIGIYQSSKSSIYIKEEEELLIISNLNNEVIATHKIPAEKGIKVINDNHKRDNSQKIELLALNVKGIFWDQENADLFIRSILQKYPRHQRDHLNEMKRLAGIYSKEELEITLKYCVDNNIANAYDFHNTLKARYKPDCYEILRPEIRPMSAQAALIAKTVPGKSSIVNYQNLFVVNK